MTQNASLQTDVVVIGAGPVGENVADRVVKGGLRAIIVERELVGGECSYWACMPSKALLRPTAALEAARRVQGAAEAVSGNVAVAEVLARRDSFTANWDDAGQVAWVEGANITLVRGDASISGVRQVRVVTSDASQVTIDAKVGVVIATGSEPRTPNIPGLADVPFWGTREATSSKHVPNSLAVIGGGVAAVELAQAYARLGSKVTVLARSGLLSKLPREAVSLVEAALVENGIDVRTAAAPVKVAQTPSGAIQVDLDSGDSVEAETLFVSTGRRPAIYTIGLEEVGVDPAGFVIDDTGLVESVDGGDWLFAVGDAAGKVLLTHQGKYEARIVGDGIVARTSADGAFEPEPWSRYRTTANSAAVPQVVFTDPEIGQVGLSKEQAEKQLGDVATVEVAIDVAGASVHADGYKGWSQLVIDRDRNVIVGATFAGQDVAEMLHAATIAIVGEVPLSRLWHAVPSYPTISEVWLRLLESWEHQWRDEGSTGRDPFQPSAR